MIFGHRATNELMWGIELCIMFHRYTKRLGIDIENNPNLADAHWLRRHWVKACMRLGDDSVLRVVRSQKEGGLGKITAPDHD